MTKFQAYEIIRRAYGVSRRSTKTHVICNLKFTRTQTLILHLPSARDPAMEGQEGTATEEAPEQGAGEATDQGVLEEF